MSWSGRLLQSWAAETGRFARPLRVDSLLTVRGALRYVGSLNRVADVSGRRALRSVDSSNQAVNYSCPIGQLKAFNSGVLSQSTLTI